LLAEGTECERRSEMEGWHDTAGTVVALDAGAHSLRYLAVGRCLPRGFGIWDTAHGMLRFRSKSGLTGLPRSASARCWQTCRVHPPRGSSRTRGATLTAHLSTPTGDVAGVGTFPGWLGLA